MSFLAKHYFNSDLSLTVQAKSVYSSDGLPSFFHDLIAQHPSFKDLNRFVSEIELDRKGIPILLKQYSSFGAKIFGFNLDMNFNDCLDCLCISYVKDIPSKKLAAYK